MPTRTAVGARNDGLLSEGGLREGEPRIYHPPILALNLFWQRRSLKCRQKPVGTPELSFDLERLHPIFEVEHEGYFISSNRAPLDLDAIYTFLTQSYWSPGIPRETVARAVSNSLCFGLFTASPRWQIGFARFVTDAATFAYLCELYVLGEYRGRGLGGWLVEQGLTHPEHLLHRLMVNYS